MNDTTEDYRATIERISNQFQDAIQRRAGPFRSHSFEFEKLAVEYSHRGFQTLTYLHGGALVAIPAALAFLKADVPKGTVMCTAAFFILGLIAVVVAQAMAFFVMAARGEANEQLAQNQINLISAEGFPVGHEQRLKREKDAADNWNVAEARRTASNRYRFFGLVLYSVSVILFLVGCSLGAYGVMTARDKAEQVTNRKSSALRVAKAIVIPCPASDRARSDSASPC